MTSFRITSFAILLFFIFIMGTLAVTSFFLKSGSTGMDPATLQKVRLEAQNNLET